ncbi:hypothetical protein [Streptomyces sp. NPDC053542]
MPKAAHRSGAGAPKAILTGASAAATGLGIYFAAVAAVAAVAAYT